MKGVEVVKTLGFCPRFELQLSFFNDDFWLSYAAISYKMFSPMHS